MKTTVLLTRRYALPALHALGNAELSSKENEEVFGPCSRLHGHDYQIEITLRGPVDPDSGLVCNRDSFDRMVQENLIAPLSGTNLSDRFPVTTGEALAIEFYRIILLLVPAPLELCQVRVYETAKNSFVVGD